MRQQLWQRLQQFRRRRIALLPARRVPFRSAGNDLQRPRHYVRLLAIR